MIFGYPLIPNIIIYKQKIKEICSETIKKILKPISVHILEQKIKVISSQWNKFLRNIF